MKAPIREGDPKSVRGVWPRNLVDLIDVIGSDFRRRGRTPEDAEGEAVAVTIAIADYFGGRPYYLPRGASLKRALRDREIFQACDGRNINELATRYGMTVTNVYSIIREQRELHRKSIREAADGAPR